MCVAGRRGVFRMEGLVEMNLYPPQGFRGGAGSSGTSQASSRPPSHRSPEGRVALTIVQMRELRFTTPV